MTFRRFLTIFAGILAAGFLLCIIAAGLLMIRYRDFLPSFPGAFFGQLTLARQTRPLELRQYKSRDFVLGQVSTWQIEEAEYIATGEELIFWEPPYAGFARTRLSPEELEELRGILVKGQIFQPATAGRDTTCLVQPGRGFPEFKPCPEGTEWMDQYASIKGWSEELQQAGVLVATLKAGGRGQQSKKVVEILLFRSEQGLVFEPVQINNSQGLKGITCPSPLVDSLTARAQAEPVPVLWDHMTGSAANQRAARVLGDGYSLALDAVRFSPEVLSAFGSLASVRPAQALNVYSSWMDSTSITLTLAVNGSKGEGAVLVRGFAPFDRFSLDIVSGGRLVGTVQ